MNTRVHRAERALRGADRRLRRTVRVYEATATAPQSRQLQRTCFAGDHHSLQRGKSFVSQRSQRRWRQRHHRYLELPQNVGELSMAAAYTLGETQRGARAQSSAQFPHGRIEAPRRELQNPVSGLYADGSADRAQQVRQPAVRKQRPFGNPGGA